MSLTPDQDFLIVLTSDPALTVYDLTNNNKELFTLKLEGEARDARALDKDNIFVLFKRNIIFISGGKITKENSLNWDGTAFEVGKRGIFVGDLVSKNLFKKTFPIFYSLSFS